MFDPHKLWLLSKDPRTMTDAQWREMVAIILEEDEAGEPSHLPRINCRYARSEWGAN